MNKDMKRIIIALAAVVLAFGASAQQGGHSNYVGLNIGGGLNTMTFSPANGTAKLGLGFDGGLHYAHFFGSHWGLGFGVHYTYANAYAVYDFSEVTPNLTHANNPSIHYNLTTKFNNWKERQTVGIIGIPVEVFFRTALSDKWSFIGGLGAEFDLPIHGKYSASEGDYSTTGVFPALGSYVVSDMPEHGFGTYDAAYDAKVDNLTKMGVSVIADAGVRFAMSNNWGLYLGIYGGYGVTDMLAQKKDDILLVINSTDPSKLDYHGTYGSNEINSLHLLRAGVKVGIDFGWNCRDRKAERLAAEEAARLARQKAIDDSIANVRRLEAERAARAKAEAEKAAAEKAMAAERAAREKAEAERAAAEAEKAAAEKAAADEKAAREKAEAERLAAERAAAERAAALRAAALQAKAEAQKKLEAIGATVYFANAGTDAKFDAKTDDAIHAICEALKADESLTVTVYGHTDNTGSLQANMKYGQKRAEALKAYMVKLGAPAASINCVSRGPNEPVADNSTDEGRAKNRRATVELK